MPERPIGGVGKFPNNLLSLRLTLRVVGKSKCRVCRSPPSVLTRPLRARAHRRK